MLLSALLLSGTMIASVGLMTIAGKGDNGQTVNHINNNTVINNHNKLTNNVNIKNSINQKKSETKDNKALETKVEAELERIQDELMEEMLQQIYINNLQNDISAKINKK